MILLLVKIKMHKSPLKTLPKKKILARKNPYQNPPLKKPDDDVVFLKQDWQEKEKTMLNL